VLELIGKLDAIVTAVRTRGPVVADQIADVLEAAAKSVRGVGDVLAFGADPLAESNALAKLEADVAAADSAAVGTPFGADPVPAPAGFDPLTALAIVKAVLDVIRMLRNRKA
jgi:hypothetical protein